MYNKFSGWIYLTCCMKISFSGTKYKQKRENKMSHSRDWMLYSRRKKRKTV